MNNLNWYWVYVPYLDPPDRQHDSALCAGYGKVCFKFDVDAEICKAKRALWLARADRAHAEWAHWTTVWLCNHTNEFIILNVNKSSVRQDPYRCTIKRNAATWRNIWGDVERKCRTKAKEYK